MTSHFYLDQLCALDCTCRSCQHIRELWYAAAARKHQQQQDTARRGFLLPNGRLFDPSTNR